MSSVALRELILAAQSLLSGLEFYPACGRGICRARWMACYGYLHARMWNVDIVELCILGLDTLGQLGVTVDTVSKQLHASREASSIG